MKNINFLSFVIALLKSLFVFVTEGKKPELIKTINLLDGARLHIIIEDSALSNETKDHIHTYIDDLSEADDEILNIASRLYYEIMKDSSEVYVARYVKKKGRFHLHKYVMSIVDRSTGKTVYQYKTNRETKLTQEHIYQKYGIYLDRIHEAMDLRGLKFKPKHMFLKRRNSLRKRRLCYSVAA